MDRSNSRLLLALLAAIDYFARWRRAFCAKQKAKNLVLAVKEQSAFDFCTFLVGAPHSACKTLLICAIDRPARAYKQGKAENHLVQNSLSLRTMRKNPRKIQVIKDQRSNVFFLETVSITDLHIITEVPTLRHKNPWAV